MAEVHNKETVILLGTVDLSTYLNDSDWTRSPDSHDLTTYGKDDHVYKGGLGDGSTDLSGKYDDSASGPRAVIEPLVGTNATLVYRPEGTGTGLPQRSVDVLVGEYKETAPIAGYRMWTCKLTHSDAVTSGAQT
jgi:hypothetical protein